MCVLAIVSEFSGRRDERTALEDADHVLDFFIVRVLATERLGAEDLVLPHGLGPIQHVVVVRLGLLPSAGAALNGAEAEAAGQAVAAAVLGGHGGVQGAPPLEALLTVVGGAVVERHVDLDHAGVGLDAQLGGRRARRVVGAVGVLQHEQAAAERQRRVDEDLVRGRDGVVVVVERRGEAGVDVGVEVHWRRSGEVLEVVHGG